MKKSETINGRLVITVKGYVNVKKNYENSNTGKRSYNCNRADLDLNLDMSFDNLSCSTEELMNSIKNEINNAVGFRNKSNTAKKVIKETCANDELY